MIWAHINAVAEVARLRENPEFWQIRLQEPHYFSRGEFLKSKKFP